MNEYLSVDVYGFASMCPRVIESVLGWHMSGRSAHSAHRLSTPTEKNPSHPRGIVGIVFCEWNDPNVRVGERMKTARRL